MENTQTQVAATVEVKLTREQKILQKMEMLKKRITSDSETFNELNAELENITRLAELAPGQQVKISQGRAETRREVVGTVVGIKEDDDGAKKYKVQIGSGFDADFAVVGGSGIIEVLA